MRWPATMRSCARRSRSHGGHVVKTTGDGVHAAFGTAHDALDASADAQRVLAAERWDGTGPLKVRMGLHTCEAELRDGDYYGSAVNRAARLMSAAHGGQVVVSLATSELVRDADWELVDLGEHRLADLARTERVFQLVVPDTPSDFPPLRSLDALPGNLPLQLTSFVGREREVQVDARAARRAPDRDADRHRRRGQDALGAPGGGGGAAPVPPRRVGGRAGAGSRTRVRSTRPSPRCSG